MLDKLFTHILDMTFTGSIVIVVVLLARLALKRMPKIFSYCLWGVVLLRLLCPVGISAPISVVPTVPSVSENYTLADEKIDFLHAGAAAMDAIGNVTNFNPDTHLVQIQPPPQISTAPAVICSPWEAWVLFGQYLWAAGVLVMVFFSLYQLLRLQQKLSEAVPIRDNIYQADGIATPFVMGLFRPKIYLPSGLTEAEQHYVLLHEQHHIRRLDHVSKALGFAALCLHWFNPLVWLAFALAGQDMEMSCDEAVIKQMGSDVRADYSQSLLRFSTGRATIAGAPLAFGEGDAGKRIRNLSKWKQPARYLLILATAACVVLSVGCAVDGTQEDPTTNGDPEVVYGSNAELIFDFESGDFDLHQTFTFHLPEYPGVLFQYASGGLYAQENGKTRPVFESVLLYDLYIADLNGDGKREFCGSTYVGSGIIDRRLLICDFADDMYYCLQERFDYDYYMGLEGDRLVVYRCRYRNQAPEMHGSLILADRRLTFVSGETEVFGYGISSQFTAKTLEEMVAFAQDYMSRGILHSTRSNDILEYYMALHQGQFGQALKVENGILRFDFGQIQNNADIVRYLTVLGLLTDGYASSFRGLDLYIYRDPKDPAQLFICTELRDCGYRDIQSYYEDLTAGKCQAHPDTYIIRLDEHAVYRWGETENLYAAATE